MPDVRFLLILSAFICAVISATGKCPVWVPVLLICVVLML